MRFSLSGCQQDRRDLVETVPTPTKRQHQSSYLLVACHATNAMPLSSSESIKDWT
jgi:hypothetical protein